ncbi:50S ribosomal protein L14e [Nanoarchaeota archaeon]
MFEIGRLCKKIAGRDARRKCLIVDMIDENYALVDGNVRRRKCNLTHLEPLPQVIKIKKGASHDEVEKVLQKE